MRKRILAFVLVAAFWMTGAGNAVLANDGAGISDFGRQAAEDFLKQMTTLFTDVGAAQFSWDGSAQVPTGRFYPALWDFEQEATYEVPEIYFIHDWFDNVVSGFFDSQGNRIQNAPWLDLATNNFAGHFRLFDFGNDGMPDIFIHFTQTFEGGYGGFYRVFRFIDSEYRALEMRGVASNIGTPWAAINSTHSLFFDDTVRIITFTNSMYHGFMQYEQLTFVGDHIEFQVLAEMDWDEWEAWDEYHWVEWNHETWEVADSWIFHNPIMFGTDIALTSIQSLTALENEIRASIMAGDAQPQTVTAAPSAHNVRLDGAPTPFAAFTIDGSNFFMLRDIAYALNGTPAQFEVSWDGAANAINLLPGQAYTPVGGEMGPAAGGATDAVPSAAAVLVNGSPVSLRAYTIGGNNFFMLRDLGEALGFEVGWDAGTATILITTH